MPGLGKRTGDRRLALPREYRWSSRPVSASPPTPRENGNGQFFLRRPGETVKQAVSLDSIIARGVSITLIRIKPNAELL